MYFSSHNKCSLRSEDFLIREIILNLIANCQFTTSIRYNNINLILNVVKVSW